MPSIQPQTPNNGSDILGLTSTGIDAVSISVYRQDSDGPLRVSSGIDAASLSYSSIGSEVLESLPSSPVGLGHNPLQNGSGMTMPRDIIKKAVATLSTTESEGEHKHPQYGEIGPRKAPPELWRRGGAPT